MTATVLRWSATGAGIGGACGLALRCVSLLGGRDPLMNGAALGALLGCLAWLGARRAS